MNENKDTVKFCKDCKHSRRNWLFGWEFGKCRAIVLSNVDLVSGKNTTIYDETYCENQRKAGWRCGPNANMFEPKKKVWYLWS